MAHPKETRDALRRAYVLDRQSLEVAAAMFGVSYGTAPAGNSRRKPRGTTGTRHNRRSCWPVVGWRTWRARCWPAW
ncbi:DUF1804 family protein [Pseudomonas aeruginosa]|nr:DUF1804 family protein [Pseudomonas aeruginosa]WMF72307.1 DUF1804 family protein [Pseudomonas aeruginosa]